MAVEGGVPPEVQAIVERARVQVPRVLQGLKGMHHLSDERLGELVGMSRQAVQARVSGTTDISQQELVAFAYVLHTDVCAIYEMAAKLPPVNHGYAEQLALPVVVDAAA